MKRLLLVLLVFAGLVGCGSGGGESTPPPSWLETITVSGMGGSGPYSGLPAGRYNLDLSGSNHNIVFSDGYDFDHVDVGGLLNSTIKIYGAVDVLNCDGSTNMFYLYGGAKTLNVSGTGINITIHVPANNTPAGTDSGTGTVLVKDLPDLSDPL